MGDVDSPRPLSKKGTSKFRSEGEKQIAELLAGLDVLTTAEMWWSQCKGNSKPLRFDFFIVVRGKCAVIEYDGRQHFEEVPDFNVGTKELTQSKDYDKRKNKFCRDRSISLLRIAYTEHKTLHKWVTEFVREVETSKSPIYRFSSPLLYINPFDDSESSGCIIS